MPELQETHTDSLIQSLRDARDVPAVLKSKLTALRSVAPEIAVFAFEGIDDKTVYFHWIKQIAPGLFYEPLVCKGKEKVLALRELLDRDKGDLKRNVYFFIDHDFDGMRGQEMSDSLFITREYAVENSLVHSSVLEEILKIEMHCDGELACRARVISIFSDAYKTFLAITKELNFRIYASRRLGIRKLKPWPAKLNQIASVSLEEISATGEAAEAVIVLEREPTAQERLQLETDFALLDPQQHYRGKFAMLFFTRWLRELATDRNAKQPKFFVGIEQDGLVAQGHYPLDCIASKSRHPVDLTQFIEKILAREKPPAFALAPTN